MFWSIDPELKSWLPKLQAHRGYWVTGAPQNTLASIQEAYRLGYKMSEFDVSLTSDRKAILFHDASYNGKLVRRTLLNELQLTLKIDEFEKLLEWLATVPDFKLNIEIKSRVVFDFHLEKLVCRLIQFNGVENRVLISSFNPFSLFKARLFLPQVRRAQLLTFNNESGNNWLLRKLVFNFLAAPHMLNLRFEDYGPQFQKLAQKIPVVLWTVNDKKNYESCKGEIHGVISDQLTPADIN